MPGKLLIDYFTYTILAEHSLYYIYIHIYIYRYIKLSVLCFLFHPFIAVEQAINPDDWFQRALK